MAVAACVLGILAGAGVAWERHGAATQARAELAGLRVELEQAQVQLRRMREERDTLHRESTEQKLHLQQLQAEMANARSFLEAEKAVSARLREEIKKMKEQFAKTDRAGAAPPRPMVVRPQPMTVIPGPRGSAAGAAVPAR